MCIYNKIVLALSLFYYVTSFALHLQTTDNADNITELPIWLTKPAKRTNATAISKL